MYYLYSLRPAAVTQLNEHLPLNPTQSSCHCSQQGQKSMGGEENYKAMYNNSFIYGLARTTVFCTF